MAKIACIVVLCMVVLIAPQAQALLTCLNVSAQVAVCLPYLTDLGPLGNCCSGVRILNLLAITPLDRQTACNCLKVQAKIIAGFNWVKAADLSTECNIDIPYLISAQLNCNTVQ